MKPKLNNKQNISKQPKFKIKDKVFFLQDDTIKEGIITEIAFYGDIEDKDVRCDTYTYTIKNRPSRDSRLDTYSCKEIGVAYTPEDLKKNMTIIPYCKME